MKDCFDFKPGWVTSFGGIRALQNYVAKTACIFVQRMEAAGAIVLARPTARSSVSAEPATTIYSVHRAIRSIWRRTPADPRAAVAQSLRTGCCRWPKAPTAAARSAFPPRGAASSATRRRSAECRMPVGRTRSGHRAVPFEGPMTRTVEDAALALSALAGYDSRDPYSIDAPHRSIRRA